LDGGEHGRRSLAWGGGGNGGGRLGADTRREARGLKYAGEALVMTVA
jgi:hypothetical protein